MESKGCPKCGSNDYEITITETLGRFQKARRTCNQCLNVWYYQDDETISVANLPDDMKIKDLPSYTKEKIDELKKEASKIIHESILQLPQNIKSHSVDRLIECLVTAASLEAYKILLESCRCDINVRNQIHEDSRR